MRETSSAVEPIGEWAQEFLDASGAVMEVDASRRWIEALIPEPLALRLGTDFLRIPLESETEETPNSLSSGSLLLERLIEESLSQGCCARWYLWAQIRKTLSLEDVTRKAVFYGVRPQGLATKIVYVPCVLFHFQVSYVCDDKQEDIVPVFFHPFLRRALPYGPYEYAMSARENELGLEEIILPPVNTLYETAKETAVFFAQDRCRLYQEREQKRFERGACRVKEYLSKARQDLERRMLREGLSEETKVVLLAKILVLETEEKRKLRDLRGEASSGCAVSLSERSEYFCASDYGSGYH